MKANELRIGNWVNNGFDKPFQILGIISKGNTGGYSLSTLKPIPLTPEILEKAGFENDNGEFTHPNNTDFDLMFCCSDNGLWCAYNYGHTNYGPFEEHEHKPPTALPICNPFKHLHQLQNIYFALTGEELEINF